MNPLRVLSLCAGIGGLDLAAEWAGFQIVGQVENNPFCQLLLQQHFPDTPLLSDLKEISTYEKEELESIFGRVDFLMGGIPCQPFSSAGKRRGIEDDRHLWPYAFILIEKLLPTWILIENVRNFATLALDLVLSDLESLHYETQAFVFPACAVGAPHIRERCFILAYSNGNRQRQRAIQHEFGRECATQANAGNDGQKRFVEDFTSGRCGLRAKTDSPGSPFPNPDRQSLAVGECKPGHARPQFQTFGSNPSTGGSGLLTTDIRIGSRRRMCGSNPSTGGSGLLTPGHARPQFQTFERIYNSTARGEFATQSRMGRSFNGISARLDAAHWPAGPGPQEEWEPPRTIKGRQKWRRQRLEALGNAVNPYQAWPFMALIKQAEEEMELAS